MCSVSEGILNRGFERRCEFGERGQSAVLNVPSLGHACGGMQRESGEGQMPRERLRSSSARPWHSHCKHLEALKDAEAWPLPPEVLIQSPGEARSRHPRDSAGQHGLSPTSTERRVKPAGCPSPLYHLPVR